MTARPDRAGLVVREEDARDADPIGRLHESAFPTPGEAALVAALRKAGRLMLSLVAVTGGDLVPPGGGLVRYAPEFAALGS